jgi:RNA polymerase sigma-70 factor, ECF subfamily
MERTLASATTIEQLYHDHHKPIRRYLYRLVRDREAAEDLCQETFIKALRHWHTLDTATAAKGWLYRIAANTALDYLRRRRCVAIAPLADEHEASMCVPAVETQFDDAEPIWLALNHLPQHYHVPLLLQIWAGYSLNDIAAALGCNVTTIKTRVHRARVRFRQIYVA